MQIVTIITYNYLITGNTNNIVTVKKAQQLCYSDIKALITKLHKCEFFCFGIKYTFVYLQNHIVQTVHIPNVY